MKGWNEGLEWRDGWMDGMNRQNGSDGWIQSQMDELND